jgi:hypothetical protein
VPCLACPLPGRRLPSADAARICATPAYLAQRVDCLDQVGGRLGYGLDLVPLHCQGNVSEISLVNVGMWF